MKFDGIGKTCRTTNENKSEQTIHNKGHMISPTHYKCEVRAYDNDNGEVA